MTPCHTHAFHRETCQVGYLADSVGMPVEQAVEAFGWR